MIIVKLKGGLGNQMFQYACGRRLSLQRNEPLKFDLSFFETDLAKLPDAKRTFDLPYFNIEGSPATVAELATLGKAPSLSSKILKKISRMLSGPIMSKPEMSPAELLAKKPSYIDGYWQSEDYFKEIESVIRKEFTPAKPLSETVMTIADQIAGSANSTCLHIRRGDYVAYPKLLERHGTCSPEYYAEALKIIEEKTGPISLFVFGDDIAWAKNNLSLPASTIYVSNPALKNFEEILLQSKCKHHIIANSSFSWWGAWLGTATDGITIAPQKWFANEPAPERLIPSSWIKI